MINDFLTKSLQGSQFRKFRDFILNIDHEDRPVGTHECVGTSSATTESRVEPDGSLSCPTPSLPLRTPRSYADVVVGKPATHGLLGVNVAKQIFVEEI